MLMTGAAGAGPAMALPVPVLAALAWYLFTRPGPRAYFAARPSAGKAPVKEEADPA